MDWVDVICSLDKRLQQKRTKLFSIAHPKDFVKWLAFDLLLEGWGRERYLEISKDQRVQTWRKW